MPTRSDDADLRRQLVWLLNGGGAHAKFDEVVKDFPAELRGKKPRGLPYSAWQLLEHLRLAQADIVDFSTNPNYQGREWPAGYWPQSPAPPEEAAWERSVRAFRADLRTIVRLIEDPKSDLNAQFAWGNGQTLLREALLLADHNAYHLGQLVLLRRLLGAWAE
jgi:hypothetical protein